MTWSKRLYMRSFIGIYCNKGENKDMSLRFITLMNPHAAQFGHFEQFQTPLIDYLTWGYRSGYGLIARHWAQAWRCFNSCLLKDQTSNDIPWWSGFICFFAAMPFYSSNNVALSCNIIKKKLICELFLWPRWLISFWRI